MHVFFINIKNATSSVLKVESISSSSCDDMCDIFPDGAFVANHELLSGREIPFIAAARTDFSPRILVSNGNLRVQVKNGVKAAFCIDLSLRRIISNGVREGNSMEEVSWYILANRQARKLLILEEPTTNEWCLQPNYQLQFQNPYVEVGRFPEIDIGDNKIVAFEWEGSEPSVADDNFAPL